jgi:hypothetical protein
MPIEGTCDWLVGGNLRALRTAVRDVVTLGLVMLCSTMHTVQLEEVSSRSY